MRAGGIGLIAAVSERYTLRHVAAHSFVLAAIHAAAIHHVAAEVFHDGRLQHTAMDILWLICRRESTWLASHHDRGQARAEVLPGQRGHVGLTPGEAGEH